MSKTPEQALSDLGITLPDAPAPAANYVPYAVTGNLVFISGQLPMVDGKLQMTGHAGANISTDLSRVKRVVKLGGFVACTNDFTEQPKVVNGASDLMVEVFGEAGRHARFAVGTNALPLGTVVEVEGTFEIA